jgi:N-acetylneuraminic acid mutarotase
MPSGRYFHASEISKQTIFTYGGLSNNVELLNDFWQFKIQEQSWLEVKTQKGPGFLCGHSLTQVKINDQESLMLIGGYSNESNYILWEYSFDKGWKMLNFSGLGPSLIFGHSVVYATVLDTHVLYMFGGYQMMNDRIEISKKLYSLSYEKENWRWSLLPVFSEMNRPEEFLPRSRFSHSSVGFSQYLILFGGETKPQNSSDFFNAYIYKCNAIH